MIEVAATDPPEALDDDAREAIVEAVAGRRFSEAAQIARGHGATELVLAVEPATPAHDSAASAAGFELVREILQLRRPLPVGLPWELETRPFRPGRDEAAWLEVNNRAFSWHPDQGGWSVDQVEARELEPWFDPEGFLLHERATGSAERRLAGFCWTKVHPPGPGSPALGEIYVIGVDPDFQGLGLGRDLTLAGLDWLAGRGVGTGMLYVESDNVPARSLYEDLGFGVHQSQRRYSM